MKVEIWCIQYVWYYTEPRYEQNFFIGPKEWAQEKANQIYYRLEKWQRNALTDWEGKDIKSVDEFKVTPYEGEKVQVYQKKEA
jgi:hypothetical protein